MSLQFAGAAAQLSSTSSTTNKSLLNVVEPSYLIDVFLKNPPVDFKAITVAADGVHSPAFLADFDLLTTLNDDAKEIKSLAERFRFLRFLHCFPTIFLGTTATEYSNYPDLHDYKPLVSLLLRELQKQRAQLCIVKDIPQRSPLLSERENERADLFLSQLEDAGFLLVEGQALAYVPIDFASIDEYMMRLSKTRRKEFRKKLKESAHVKVEELNCGDGEFFDDIFLEQLYEMYLQVFAQSEIHFDLLSPGFFSDLLQDPTGGGKVFCYKVDGRLIGYNICFVEGSKLVDKYIGLTYPEARQANLYFVSWFYNLEYALRQGLKIYVAGWTDPKVKAALGAKFTMTRHAVYIRSGLLRTILKPFKHMFESDSEWGDKQVVSSAG